MTEEQVPAPKDTIRFRRNPRFPELVEKWNDIADKLEEHGIQLEVVEMPGGVGLTIKENNEVDREGVATNKKAPQALHDYLL